ncbi:sulfite exporter TauE/SafE family protein [Zobellella endophytica]|uniref:Probable membrane transporter protein n=1 Tax=Zobellella endophytica TaxID=2116700 RepID=A0A2P7RDA5_9GAMM|nr:sulfite exporter TauE/SafE family protein [Zobellella endophytica]PSJ48218.1 sulfite exporter TauE/SafE family protein [Zobellella endophytica]
MQTVTLDPSILILAALACFTGAYVQTAIGFGMAVIAAPLMFYLDPALVPGPLAFVILAMCTINGWRFRQGLELKLLAPALLARIPGSVVGVILLGLMSQQLLAILIALVIMLGVLVRLVDIALPMTRTNLAIGGFLSGVMGTSTTIGGPPMVLVMHGADMHRIRANLAGFFVVSSLMSMIALVGGGYFGQAQLLQAAPLVPAALLGNWLAVRTLHRVSKPVMHYGSLSLCTLAVIGMLINTLS